jgi:hypothetical protein
MTVSEETCFDLVRAGFDLVPRCEARSPSSGYPDVRRGQREIAGDFTEMAHRFAGEGGAVEVIRQPDDLAVTGLLHGRFNRGEQGGVGLGIVELVSCP